MKLLQWLDINSKRRSGNHKTKGISEISGTTKSHSNKRTVKKVVVKDQFKMREVILVQSKITRINFQKKLKKFLKMVLSKKLKDGKLKIIDE